MQSRVSPFARSMTPSIPVAEAGVGHLLDAGTGPELPLERPAAMPKKALRERLRRPLLILFPILLAVAGGAYHAVQAPYVSTDDAFIRAAKESINARVAGQVAAIAVEDNQPVRKGQILFRLDPAPYQIAVARAEAQLESARLQIAALKATYRQQQADLQAAEDAAGFDARDYARENALVASAATPRVMDDRAGTDLKIAQQHVASIEQQIASIVAALNGDPDIAIDRHPSVRAAQAELDRARLNLSYATVVAPDDGIVTGVDDLQAGDFVDPGATTFWLLSSRRIWVEANFRETDLTHMRPGQKAVIEVDAYPGRRLAAHVVSMSPGTGSDFAILPPENATGNWVKVIQRLPVRLELDEADPGLPLFSGLSAAVRVDTGARRSWHHPLRTMLAMEGAE